MPWRQGEMWPDIGWKGRALDRCGKWLDVKVVETRGKGDSWEVKVHFHGWAPSYDEWIPAPYSVSDRLMDHGNYKGVDPPKPDDPEFEVDKILKKRKRGGENQYLIHWVGFDDSHDSWEAEDDIDDTVIKVHPPTLHGPTILTPHTIFTPSALASTYPPSPSPCSLRSSTTLPSKSSSASSKPSQLALTCSPSRTRLHLMWQPHSYPSGWMTSAVRLQACLDDSARNSPVAALLRCRLALRGFTKRCIADAGSSR